MLDAPYNLEYPASEAGRVCAHENKLRWVTELQANK